MKLLIFGIEIMSHILLHPLFTLNELLLLFFPITVLSIIYDISTPYFFWEINAIVNLFIVLGNWALARN